MTRRGCASSVMVFGPAKFKEALEYLIGGWMDLTPQLAEGSEGWPKPTAVHLDFICGGFVVELTKKIIGPECKTLVWWSSAVVSLPSHFTDHDFFAIFDEIYANEWTRQGHSKDEILQQVFEVSNGTDKHSGAVVEYPGGPDMYDAKRHAYAAGPYGKGAFRHRDAGTRAQLEHRRRGENL
ncbi:hypothetical protein DFH06DRAFT_750043 [Mycena polygramma]|nr:hypothetical protein DFH06DRAFT_750043 [Mycena polygramma]